MSSAYGRISAPSPGETLPLPLHYTLKDGEKVTVEQVQANADPAELDFLQTLLNEEINAGDTYPQEIPLNKDEFMAYFLSYSAFVVRSGQGKIMGTFYIKPNFPGRCSHICNGGFVTHLEYRQRGTKKVQRETVSLTQTYNI
ncbi:hypothetical protein HDU76_004786 [Blyttiomyces sp. JEL0837]|nr:hypothetical protein HDU76_004786 [Blyttiomyces sp. JEL0837]